MSLFTNIKSTVGALLSYKEDRCKQLLDEKKIDERLHATFESNQCNKDVFEYLMNVRKFNQRMGDQAQSTSILNLQVLSTERLKQTDAFQRPVLETSDECMCETLRDLNKQFNSI